jgi:type II secretory pathway pseudopilin PulG
MISRKGAKAQRRSHPNPERLGVLARGKNLWTYGFTLIEVVIAFIVAALVIAASASALVATLRSEATSHRQAQAVASLRTLQTQLWLGAETNSLATNLPPDWALENEVVEQGEGTNHVVWTVWRIGPTARASFSASLATAAP